MSESSQSPFHGCYLCRKPCVSYAIEEDDRGQPVRVCIGCLEEAAAEREVLETPIGEYP